MDKQSLPIRVLAAGLPLLVIALVAGAIGYATTQPAVSPIPALADAAPGINATQGEVTGVSGDQLTLVDQTGASVTYALAPGATIEVLEPISLAMVAVGDWLNGGAIPHPDTILALISLILLPDPMTP